jgi:limonene-1,2-epoxide hydrolase
MPDCTFSDSRLCALKHFYETLTLETLKNLDQLYDTQARFKDPFNEVQGVAAIQAIFNHMFATVQQPRFKVLQAFSAENQAFMSWRFTFSRAGSASEMVIHGATHVVFTSQGKVSVHRDYWDAAEELYEKLPVLGGLMRYMRRRLKAT